MRKVLLILFFLCVLPCCLARAETVFIHQIIDGDTLKIKNGKRIRLIGIDAPEMYEGEKLRWDSTRSQISAEEIKKLGHASKDFLEGIFQKAGTRKVFLRYDRYNVYTQHEDKYGRKLAYVYALVKDKASLPESWICEDINGKIYIFLNATMLKEGYVFVYTFADYEKKEDFLTFEEKAREQKSGLWKEQNGFPRIWECLKKMRAASSSKTKIAQ